MIKFTINKNNQKTSISIQDTICAAGNLIYSKFEIQVDLAALAWRSHFFVINIFLSNFVFFKPPQNKSKTKEIEKSKIISHN